MNIFDRHDKWLMRLCFIIAFLLLLSVLRFLVNK